MKLSRKLGRWLRRGKVGDPAVGPSRKVYSRSFAQKTYSPIHHIHIEVPGVKHTTFFGPLTTKQRGNHHQNVSVPAPAFVRGDGGEGYLMAWFGACTLFGAATPADVLALCRHSRVTGRPAAGALHLSAEAFADRA